MNSSERKSRKKIWADAGMVCFTVLMTVFSICRPVQAQPVPLIRAHAHNDYEHDRPLLDALDHGFCSVEADIHLVDGQLLVAHDLEDVHVERTLQALYLDPLRERIRRNGGRVYVNGPSVILLIDIKSDAAPTYRVLRDILKQYEDILTVFTAEEKDEGAVTVILSGNRPREILAAELERLAAFDGRLNDLQDSASVPPAFMPLVSSNWAAIAPWYGVGSLSYEARQRLHDTVSTAHAQGRKIRFWATSDNPVVWKELYDAGVDLLNADNLERLKVFLSDMEK